MEKLAETEFEIHELIKKRWSPRSFSDRTVDPELIRQLFDAARWAPSSFNEQPWRFIYARKEDSKAFGKLSRVMVEFNRKWASDAPVLILTIVKERFSRNNKPNRVAEHDTGSAMSYLTFEATRHDLYVHQMAGIDQGKAKELFDIPEGFKPFTMAAVGYLGNPDDLDEDLRKSEIKPRSRKPIHEIAFRGEWNG